MTGYLIQYHAIRNAPELEIYRHQSRQLITKPFSIASISYEEVLNWNRADMPSEGITVPKAEDEATGKPPAKKLGALIRDAMIKYKIDGAREFSFLPHDELLRLLTIETMTQALLKVSCIRSKRRVRS